MQGMLQLTAVKHFHDAGPHAKRHTTSTFQPPNNHMRQKDHHAYSMVTEEKLSLKEDQ